VLRAPLIALAALAVLACASSEHRPPPGVGPHPGLREAPAAASAEIERRRQLLGLVEFLSELFSTRYAPITWKYIRHRFDLRVELASLSTYAEAGASDADFRRALYRFFRAPRDIHTSVWFEAPRAVWLGLHVRRTEDGYRVAWIDRTVLPRDRVPIDVGDEVVTFDGAEIDSAVRRTVTETEWRSTPDFEQAFGEWFLVFRTETEWGTVPEAGTEVELSLRRGEETIVARIPWRDVDSEQGVPPGERCPFWGGTAESYVPELGTVIERVDDTEQLSAHVFAANGRRYGYVRIPSYAQPRLAQGAAIAELDRAVDLFHSRRVAGVVIDQTGNGGGNYVFGLALLSRLSPVPLRAPFQRYRITPFRQVAGWEAPERVEAILSSLAAVEDDAGAVRLAASGELDAFTYLPATLETVTDLRDFFLFLAEPPLSEPERIAQSFQLVREHRLDPARGRPYTGPLLFLVDELNLSAAEFVAAAFADAGRATLFGVTTAGAGGDQRTITPDRVCGEAPDELTRRCAPRGVAAAMRRLGIAGMAYTVTIGIRYTPEGALIGDIENAGVRPHVPYRITADDLQLDYAPMRQAILAALRNARPARRSAGP
jgi:hypothetical protein